MKYIYLFIIYYIFYHNQITKMFNFLFLISFHSKCNHCMSPIFSDRPIFQNRLCVTFAIACYRYLWNTIFLLHQKIYLHNYAQKTLLGASIVLYTSETRIPVIFYNAQIHYTVYSATQSEIHCLENAHYMICLFLLTLYTYSEKIRSDDYRTCIAVLFLFCFWFCFNSKHLYLLIFFFVFIISTTLPLNCHHCDNQIKSNSQY